MSALNRRKFLALTGAAGAGAVVARPRRARGAALAAGADDTAAMLVDTTRCLGCRACEAACSEKNGLPAPVDGEEVFARRRQTASQVFTVVNRHGRGDSPIYVKTQCMHCVTPACASACVARALTKTPEGPVVYDPSVCIGCRYCMVACPFGLPRFEYERALPFVRKCLFCIDRQRRGQVPACAAVCPAGTLTFGPRGKLLEEARARIYRHPERYHHHIYGEQEVGGTGWLYLAAVPFEQLAFRTDLGTRPYVELTSGALSTVPFVLTLGVPVLMGLYAFGKLRQRTRDRAAEPPHDPADDEAPRGTTREEDRHE